MEKNTGGPAFPIPLQNGQSWQSMAPCDGMTLRDYFAAKAVHAQPTFPASLWQAIRWALGLPYTAIRFSTEQFAQRAYQIADAMLKARDA